MYVVEVGSNGKYRKRAERHTWQGSIGRRALFQAIQQQPPPEQSGASACRSLATAPP